MADKKKKKESSSSELIQEESEMNMTPMIDVVFNLIIFFMVITDMTQQDLEYLILPKALQAAVDEGDDPDRMIVNVVNANLKQSKGRVRTDWPPIFFKGAQVDSMETLRKLLFRVANPNIPENQERVHPTTGKSLAIAPGVYPSNKALLIRCDQGQIFGWVQLLMQYCTFLPNEPLAEARKNQSPFIWKIEIAVAENKPAGQ